MAGLAPPPTPQPPPLDMHTHTHTYARTHIAVQMMSDIVRIFVNLPVQELISAPVSAVYLLTSCVCMYVSVCGCVCVCADFYTTQSAISGLTYLLQSWKPGKTCVRRQTDRQTHTHTQKGTKTRKKCVITWKLKQVDIINYINFDSYKLLILYI